LYFKSPDLSIFPFTIFSESNFSQGIPHGNSLVIANEVPGAWLVQIKDAGHAVPDQYPEEVGKILQTFLSTVR
jgi:pimeloyl-ACP methyl ester carboxylesterase